MLSLWLMFYLMPSLSFKTINIFYNMRNIMGGNVIYIKCIERILGHFIYFMTDYKLGNNYSFETKVVTIFQLIFRHRILHLH